MIIDAHINIADTGLWGPNKLDVSAKTILRYMDDAKVEKGVLLAISGIASNKTLESFLKTDPDRFFGFGNLEDYEDVDKSIQELKKIGAVGVKIHPRFEKIIPEDLSKNRVFQKIEKSGLVLNICGWLQSSHVPIESLTPLKIDKIAKQHPNLKIIISHLGGHQFWDAFFVARANNNVFLDTSYFSEFFEGTSLFNDYVNSAKQIDQKLIFGSDFPEISIEKALTIQQSNFKLNSGVDLNRLFSQNFIELI